MTPRDRVIRTLNHQTVDRAPRDLWLPPGMESHQREELDEIDIRCPSDITHLDARSVSGKRSKTAPHRAGHFTDVWGCTWELGPHGSPGPLVEVPLADPSRIAAYEPPAELLETSRFTRANRSCEGSMRFVLAWSEVRPVDRLLSLRGREAAIEELSSGNKDVLALADKLHDFFCRELEHWAGTDVDGVVISDDLATAEGACVTPKLWRSLFEPMYRQYCDILHARDKFVFVSGGSRTGDLFDDLVELGADAIHSDMHLVDIEKLALKDRGRVTFWVSIDRGKLEPPRDRKEIRDDVFRVRKALDYGAGGVIAQCQWTESVPLRNLVAFFEEWMMPLPVNV